MHVLASILAVEMVDYAGDPHLSRAEHAKQKAIDLLNSDRHAILSARVCVQAHLRDVLMDPAVQAVFFPFLSKDENMQAIMCDERTRLAFFSRKRDQLRGHVLSSPEQAALKQAHGALAAWEKENAVLLRHPMFMSYKPAQTLLLESTETISLYREYASLGEAGGYRGDGDTEKDNRDGAARTPRHSFFTVSTTPFTVDADTKMFSQEVLQNKRVEYEELRAAVASSREALEQSLSLQHLARFMNVCRDLFRNRGIDGLIALCGRLDERLCTPNEGGVPRSVQSLPRDDPLVASNRVAQYALPHLITKCHSNFFYSCVVSDLTPMARRTGRFTKELSEHLQVLKDADTFRYWFLACLTADVPQVGPNKLVGKKQTQFEDYEKYWTPQKSSYVPSISGGNRTGFAKQVAERLGFPHLVVLSPISYSYRQNNDPDAVMRGSFDLVVYDMVGEQVLLIVADSSSQNDSCGAYLRGQEERFRLAAVLRTVLANENELHCFSCEGEVAEYFFDPESGPEENFYCIMAPTKISTKTPNVVKVPATAFAAFARCPPRIYRLGGSAAVSTGTTHNPYPDSFAHIALHQQAIALQAALPPGFVEKNVLPYMESGAEGFSAVATEESRRPSVRFSATPSPTSRAGGGGGSTKDFGGSGGGLNDSGMQSDDAGPFSPLIAEEALTSVRTLLLRHKSSWSTPHYMQERTARPDLRKLPAARDGVFRTPLVVFSDFMESVHGKEVPWL